MKTYLEVLEKKLLKRINKVINYARNHSPYYGKLFKEIRLPKVIEDFSQFESIPITFRGDLAKRNDEFIAVPKDKWADLVATSASTGKAIYVPFTKKDILKNADFIANKFSVFGLREKDIAYITVPVDQSMWIGGLSVWLGCLETGACCIRAGNVSMEKHIEFLERFRPTVIFGFPSFILKLGEEIKIRKLRKISKPRLIVTFGENIMNRDFSRNSLGKAIERLWSAQAISGYGSAEGSPGFECSFQQGHHILTEMIHVEIVDPKAGKAAKPKEDGLVVMTHFGREGLPLIRYAPGDISFLDKEICKCGRTTPRLGPVLGRIDEMAKIKGVNIYPSQLETFLLGNSFIRDFVVELFSDKDFYDKIKLHIRFKTGFNRRDAENKFGYLQNKLKDMFGIKIEIRQMKDRGKEEDLKIKQRHVIDNRIKEKL